MQTIYPWHYKPEQPKRTRRAGSSTRPRLPRTSPDTPATYRSTYTCNGTRRRTYSATLKHFSSRPDKPKFTSTQLHSPERLFLLTAVFFSLSNTCHDTWPSSFLPPSNFHSSNFCCLRSMHNFCLKSSSTRHFNCYQQQQTSPRQLSANSLHFTPKDQLMKCKTSVLFD